MKPANNVQDLQYFGEFGGVNPSITDSSTFTFLHADSMSELFEIEKEGCYLYSRHTNPSNKYLSDALAAMEGTEAAHCAGSGMGSIASTIFQLCSSGDEIVSSRTIYGGTYALFKNFLPKFKVKTNFVDITDLEIVRATITPNTKVLYCETLSNPLMEVADIPALSKIAKEHNLKLVVDNTFTPMIMSPIELGADIVIHSLTKFINGTSDAVGGVTCASKEFIASMKAKYPNMETTATGLMYVVEKPGDGPKPELGAKVEIDYAGYLIDGTMFDTSIEELAKENGVYNAQRQYQPYPVSYGPQAQVINGWKEGMQLFNIGGKGRLIIPPHLAYGAAGAGGVIPPNAWLIFDIELVRLTK